MPKINAKRKKLIRTEEHLIRNQLKWGEHKNNKQVSIKLFWEHNGKENI